MDKFPAGAWMNRSLTLRPGNATCSATCSRCCSASSAARSTRPGSSPTPCRWTRRRTATTSSRTSRTTARRSSSNPDSHPHPATAASAVAGCGVYPAAPVCGARPAGPRPVSPATTSSGISLTLDRQGFLLGGLLSSSAPTVDAFLIHLCHLSSGMAGSIPFTAVRLVMGCRFRPNPHRRAVRADTACAATRPSSGTEPPCRCGSRMHASWSGWWR